MKHINTKQILEVSLESYLILKRELTNLSTDRLVLRNKLIVLMFSDMSDSPAKQEIKQLIEEIDKGIQRLLQKSMRISYYLAVAYGCQFCEDGYEDHQAFIAAANRVREKLFTILSENSIMDLPDLAVDSEDDFYIDMIDLGNIYSRYFEAHVVEPRIDLAVERAIKAKRVNHDIVYERNRVR